MINRIITFGDSWTAGQGNEPDDAYKEVFCPDHFIFQLRAANGWPRYLAEKFDVQYVNMGLSASNNAQIVMQLGFYKNHWHKDDLILIMWSYPYRHIGMPKQDGLPDYGNLPINEIVESAEYYLDGYNYYFVNGFYPYFYDEPEFKKEINLDRWIDIDRSASHVLIDYEHCYENSSVWEFGHKNAGNNQGKWKLELGEYHPNNFGYKIIANWLYLELQNRLNK